MRTPLLPTLILGLSLAGAATAQQKAALPPDVNPVSLTRLPPLTRNDLNDEGKAIYDKIRGTGAAPVTGPVALSLYSPKIALTFVPVVVTVATATSAISATSRAYSSRS